MMDNKPVAAEEAMGEKKVMEFTIVEDRLQEIEKAPREAMIAKAEAKKLCDAYRFRQEFGPIDPTLTGAQRREKVEERLRLRARFDNVPRVEYLGVIGGWFLKAYSEDYAKSISALTLAETHLEEARIRIHDLEANCDPAGNVQTIASQKEQIDGLLTKLQLPDNGFLPLEEALAPVPSQGGEPEKIIIHKPGFPPLTINDSLPPEQGGEPEPSAPALEDEYYIQDSRSYCGNAVMWWCPNGKGYTSNLQNAWRVPRGKALMMQKNRPTDIPCRCEAIDLGSFKIFDMQNLRAIREAIHE